MTVFVREYLGEALGGEFRHRVGSPVSPAGSTYAATGENDGRICGLLQQWQEHLGHRKYRRDVDVHDFLPQHGIVLLD